MLLSLLLLLMLLTTITAANVSPELLEIKVFFFLLLLLSKNHHRLNNNNKIINIIKRSLWGVIKFIFVFSYFFIILTRDGIQNKSWVKIILDCFFFSFFSDSFHYFIYLASQWRQVVVRLSLIKLWLEIVLQRNF